MADHIETGLHGETLAADYLIRQGWEILARRWRDPAVGGLRTDIDLVALDPDTRMLHFVEVKTRSHDDLPTRDYAPERAVGSGKLERMLAAAERYMACAQIDGELSVDLCVVVPGTETPRREPVVRYYPDLGR